MSVLTLSDDDDSAVILGDAERFLEFCYSLRCPRNGGDDSGRAAEPLHQCIDIDFEGRFRGVDSTYIPGVGVAPCPDDMFPGETVDQAGLVPGRGHFAEKVEVDSRSVFKVVGRNCEVLYRVLVDHCQCKFKRVCRAAGVAMHVVPGKMPVQEGAAIFHTSCRVSDEWVQAGACCLQIAVLLTENEVLGCEHRFAADIVGVHSLPAAGDGAAMEDHHQGVVVGIAEDVFIKAHCLLLVASEEVNLDSLDAYAFKPAHLLFPRYGLAHDIGRTLNNVVPPAA